MTVMIVIIVMTMIIMMISISIHDLLSLSLSSTHTHTHTHTHTVSFFLSYHKSSKENDRCDTAHIEDVVLLQLRLRELRQEW